MRTAANTGRWGGLAAALGVGTAVMTGCAIAAADPGSPGPTDSSANSSSTRGSAPSGSVLGPKRVSGEKPTSKKPASNASSNRLRVSATKDARGRPASATRGRLLAGAAKAGPDLPALPSAPEPGPAAAAGAVRPAIPSLASVPAALGAPINPAALPPRPAFAQIWVAVGSSLMGLAQSGFRAFSIAGYLGPTKSTLNQTLVVNGYDLVPSSTELVTSFYGQWTYWPGGPTLLQGQQKYSLVDPITDENLGTFDALVSTGSPFNVRSKYVELLVTSNDGINVGTGAGQIPPVGSLIATFDLIGGFGWSYSAMPASPKAAVKFSLMTPFGDIALPFGFDASKGIADHTVDNQPVDLANGYSIVPRDPEGETYLGTSGFLPYYTTVQARDVFDLRDSSGNTVGSFEGVVTPTSDVMGVNTQAILVTDVMDGTVGTTPGDVPPVGSVFNVMYQGSDTKYVLYSSLPSTSGDVVSVISVNGDHVSNIATFPLDLLNASALPTAKRLPATRGYSYLPLSAIVPSGINGLPPREIQVQGYQQFGVYDSAGFLRGAFDADVSTQLDMYGIYSQSILVTKVTDGAAGTSAGDVPPVGSIINYVYLGNSGFGTYYSSMPSALGGKTSFKFLTPLIDIPTWSTYNASAGLTDVEFYSPFSSP